MCDVTVPEPNRRARSLLAICLYLAAIVAANLVTARFGAEASVYTALWLVGLTFVVRDVAHDLWPRHRLLKMGALIAAGATLSYLVSPDAAGVAVASCVTFAVAESADALLYQLTIRRPWLERSNLSNLLGAAVDSILFPWIAFGGLLWTVTWGQFTGKVAGGVLFSLALVLMSGRARRVPA